MINLIERKKLWNNGYVELWDFTESNSEKEICSLVSGVCYDKNIANKEKHYKRLLTENGGRASEVLGFIPAIKKVSGNPTQKEINDYYRFGYIDEGYFYTNLRNLINNHKIKEEYDVKNFVAMKIKIPYMIVDHLRRHGMLNNFFAENWQSNRSKHKEEYFQNEEVSYCVEKNIIITKEKCRQELINKGEFGLRYVTGWLSGWLNDPMTWENMFRVRDANNTQKETKELINVMKGLVQKHY